MDEFASDLIDQMLKIVGKKWKEDGETYKVNSTNSTNQIDLVKYGFDKSEINKNTNFEKTLIASKVDTVNNSVQNESAISAIRNQELGKENEDISTDDPPSRVIMVCRVIIPVIRVITMIRSEGVIIASENPKVRLRRTQTL